MNFWTLFFIVCLELLSNATRADEPRETKVLRTRIASLEPSVEDFAQDKKENKSADYALVKKIRAEFLKDHSITSNSKNVQIIVVGKEITLKGPVSSAKDQTALLDIAKKYSTDHTIRNQLEVIRE